MEKLACRAISASAELLVIIVVTNSLADPRQPGAMLPQNAKVKRVNVMCKVLKNVLLLCNMSFR